MKAREWLIVIMAVVLALIYGYQLVKGQDLILKRLTTIEQKTTATNELVEMVFAPAKVEKTNKK